MSVAKIASFYDDPVKQACDAWSMAKAFSFRKVTLDKGIYWRAQRWAQRGAQRAHARLVGRREFHGRGRAGVSSCFSLAFLMGAQADGAHEPAQQFSVRNAMSPFIVS